MHFVTDFADQAVVVPMIFAVGVTLWFLGWRRGSISWLGILGCTLFAMLLVKLFGIACGPSHLPRMRTPSGHTAAAAVLAGSLAAVVVQQRRCLAAMLTACAAACVIGSSRYLLGLHSLSEVLAGSVVGIAGAVAFAWTAGPAPRMQLRLLAVPIVLVLVIFHGHRLNVEPHIWRTVYVISHRLGVCRGNEPWSQFYSRGGQTTVPIRAVS